jgi:CheY-like chemotaxis protein
MSAAESRSEKATSILMVEDEEHIRQLTAAVLERAGFTVHQACDATEASEIWERDRNSLTFWLRIL